MNSSIKLLLNYLYNSSSTLEEFKKAIICQVLGHGLCKKGNVES